jgi:hypothetical protein
LKANKFCFILSHNIYCNQLCFTDCQNLHDDEATLLKDNKDDVKPGISGSAKSKHGVQCVVRLLDGSDFDIYLSVC